MKIMVRNRQRKSTIGMFIEEKAMTQTNIIVGFKKTGIFPLDEYIFDECDFLPSLVIDQPNDASILTLNVTLNKQLSYDQWWIFKFRGPRQGFPKIDVL